MVGLLISSIEEFSIYSPGVTASTNRETIGIVTQIDRPDGDPARAERWLRLAGCEKIFYVSAKQGIGLKELMDYLDTDGPGPEDKNKAKTDTPEANPACFLHSTDFRGQTVSGMLFEEAHAMFGTNSQNRGGMLRPFQELESRSPPACWAGPKLDFTLDVKDQGEAYVTCRG